MKYIFSRCIFLLCLLTTHSFAQPVDSLKSKCAKAFNLVSKNTPDIAIDDVHYTCKINGLDNSIIYLFALSPSKYEDNDKDFGYYDLTAYLLSSDSITKKSTFKDFHISDWGNKFAKMAVDKIDYDVGGEMNGIGLFFTTEVIHAPYDTQSTTLIIFEEHKERFALAGKLPHRFYISNRTDTSETITYTTLTTRNNKVNISGTFFIKAKYLKTVNGSTTDKKIETRKVFSKKGEYIFDEKDDFPCTLC